MKNRVSYPGMTTTDILAVAVCGAILYGFVWLLLLITEALTGF
jgi:hypothetical protein